MALESKTFLAATVLNDGKIVSYRSLSRELNVHNNVAKKMLYEFHHAQNSKKTGSVHATYLLDGVPQVVKEPNGTGYQPDSEDVHMQSSPYMSSSMPQEEDEEDRVPSRKITLAREEDVNEAKAKYESIHSIHIYSLSPSTVHNLQTLSECNRSITARFLGEDPLIAGKRFGVIQNPGVKRRSAKQPTVPIPAASAVRSIKKTSKDDGNAKEGTQTSKESSRPPSSGTLARSTSQADTKSKGKTPSNKSVPLKSEQSDIFKSFSKPKAQLSRENTGSSIGLSPAPTHEQPHFSNHAPADKPMEDASEAEDEDEFMETVTKKSKTGKSRSQREEELRQMMDDDDDDMEGAVEEPAKAAVEKSESIDAPTSQKAASPDPPAVVTEGRRHGKRKVMKRVQTKDDEGYLVTKEAPVWESFSEDEPAPRKERTPASTASSSKGKAKKAGGMPGQGGIMSFLTKK